MAGNLPPGCTQDECDRAQPGYWDDEPDYEPEPDYDACEHEEYEIGWDGRAMCHRCGYAWWATSEQIAAEAEHQRAYAEWVAEQERPWSRFKEWCGRHVSDLKWRWRRWRQPARSIDDEIPF